MPSTTCSISFLLIARCSPFDELVSQIYPLERLDVALSAAGRRPVRIGATSED